MKSWNSKQSKMVETPPNVIAFLNDLHDLMDAYNLSIAHEDSQGAFIIELYDIHNVKCLREAMLNLE